MAALVVGLALQVGLSAAATGTPGARSSEALRGKVVIECEGVTGAHPPRLPHGRCVITGAITDGGTFVDDDVLRYNPHGRTFIGAKGTIRMSVYRERRGHWTIIEGTKPYAGLRGRGWEKFSMEPCGTQRFRCSISLTMTGTVASATARAGSSPTTANVGRVSDSHGTRQTLTEQGVRFSFRVPTTKPGWVGWERFSSISTRKSPGGPISLNKSVVGPQGAEAIIYWTSFPDGDYADPCAHLLEPSDGRSSAVLAAAVAAASGIQLLTVPSDVTLGGHPAKHVVVRVRSDVGCDPGFFYTWKDVFGGALWPTTAVGDTIRVWIVSVGGTRLFIQAATTVEANARLKKEVKQIVESIRFE